MISQISLQPYFPQTKSTQQMLHPTSLQLWTTQRLSKTLVPGWNPAGGSLSLPSGERLSSFLQAPEQPLSQEVLQEIQGVVCPNELLEGMGLFYTTTDFLSALSQPGKKHKAEVIVASVELAALITKLLAHSLGHPALERASNIAGLVLKFGKKVVVYVHKP